MYICSNFCHIWSGPPSASLAPKFAVIFSERALFLTEKNGTWLTFLTKVIWAGRFAVCSRHLLKFCRRLYLSGPFRCLLTAPSQILPSQNLSGIRESNSLLILGKDAYYRCTNPAFRRYTPQCKLFAYAQRKSFGYAQDYSSSTCNQYQQFSNSAIQQLPILSTRSFL